MAARTAALLARLLRAGQNLITLTVPAGPLTAGVTYACLRLALGDAP